MKKSLIGMAIFLSVPALANDITRCGLQYDGDESKFSINQFSYMGIPSDAYLYTCANCGGIQINVFPAVNSMTAYEFSSQKDFLQKISSEYNQKDIAKLEISSMLQGRNKNYTLLDTGIAEFYPDENKVSYLYFNAKNADEKQPVGYQGFVSSNGSKSCTILISYPGTELSQQGRKSLSYYMNHVSIPLH